MTDEIAEWTVPEGLENNAELVMNFYTHMVFDSGDVAIDQRTPTNEVLRKQALHVRSGQNIIWTATIIAGDFTANTDIRAIWMVGKNTDNEDVWLCCHKVMPVTVNSAQGMMYEFPYTISGYLEEYDEE